MSLAQYAGQPDNRCTTKAGLTGISGAATTYTTSNTILYSIDGKAYSKSGVSGGTTPTVSSSVTPNAAITLTAGYVTVVVWAVNSGGTVTLWKGETVASGDIPEFPTLSDTVTAFAYTVHTAGSTVSGTWTLGVSNWNAAGMSHVVVDVMTLPNRPQLS